MNIFSQNAKMKKSAKAGYTNCSDDDLLAAYGPSKKIGLIYHRLKGYEKTNWREVE